MFFETTPFETTPYASPNLRYLGGFSGTAIQGQRPTRADHAKEHNKGFQKRCVVFSFSHGL